jgi:hypothetical protein
MSRLTVRERCGQVAMRGRLLEKGFRLGLNSLHGVGASNEAKWRLGSLSKLHESVGVASGTEALDCSDPEYPQPGPFEREPGRDRC